MKRVQVSTWALDSIMGTVNLLNVPAMLRDHGYSAMELCHFHIPDTSPAYLKSLRDALEDSEVQLWSLLIDDGDVAHPENSERDEQFIKQWLERAETLGATCSRVIGGKQEPTEEAIERVIEHLGEIGAFGAVRGIRVMTENWHETLSSPAVIKRVLHDTGLELCFDFGNWSGPDKYDRLREIAPLAASCHAKCEYIAGAPNKQDFSRCLGILRESGYEGPYTLVHGEPMRLWESLDEQRSLIQA